MINGGRGVGGARRETRIVHVVGRAVGAHDLVVGAHVDVDVRMIEWRKGAYALEFLGSYLDLAEPLGVVEVRRGVVRHGRIDPNGGRAPGT